MRKDSLPMLHTVRNLTRQADLATQARLATDPFSRLLGWLGRQAIASGEGLILRPCSGIHMVGMRCAIDAIYVDAGGCVLHTLHGLRPWRIGPLDPRAAYVVELPPGTLAATATLPGDLIALE